MIVGLHSSFLFFLCSLCSVYNIGTFASPATFGFKNETDQQALLAIKDQISNDPLNALSSWNNSLHFCSWQGVKCGRRHQRVTALNLSSVQLAGSLSPCIGNLTFLRVIFVPRNNFYGSVPQEVGRLFRLEILSLANNSFQGELPMNLSHCSNLRDLNLYGNNLRGKILVELGTLPDLYRISLGKNHLTGSIPSSCGNISGLRILSLIDNDLDGSIPVELEYLNNLEFLQLSSNNLSGMVPKQLYNISSIYFFSVADNQLSGHLPLGLDVALPYIQYLYLGGNQFSGPIPASIANASGLVQLDLGMNLLKGPVPKNLDNLQNLEAINLGRNPLGNQNNSDLTFLTSLTNCTNLSMMWFYQNRLIGVLPNSIVNLSTSLSTLRLDHNYLTGEIPPEIENLKGLEYLALFENMLTGEIPSSIGKISTLQELHAHANKFSGQIPSAFGNIAQLRRLDLSNNFLEGSIPLSLANCTNLESLDVSYNNLDGLIPEKVVGLPSLISLHLDSNSLTGSLPSQVGNMEKLLQFDISENNLSGPIPITLENCLMLVMLKMDGNFFEGSIPSFFKKLRSIQVLDLSRNNLSGQIPEFLGELPLLENLNLSYNKFDGDVPTGGQVFKNASAFSVAGNNKLCGGIKALQLPACPAKKPRHHFSGRAKILVTSFALFIFLLLAGLCAIICWKKSSKSNLSSSSTLEKKYQKVTYTELVRATEGFSSDYMIGDGRYGTVYKAILGSNNQTVAVKVLKLQQRGSNKTFMSECEVLRNIRHRNLVKIVTSCSTIDFKGNDFKALIYEFMPNGSLETWLHPSSMDTRDSKALNLFRRMNIAIDVTLALDYLHNHCETPVVHCDLKPSNILLDNELTAHLGDFGLARALLATIAESIPVQTSSNLVKGTVGYIPPEYGMGGKVSIQGDVYAFGILLLEMFTGKRPTDSMFAGSFNLNNFVRTAIPDRVMDIVDPLLTVEEEFESSRTGQGTIRINIARIEACLTSILHIGILCSADLPSERMKMGDVLKELHKIQKMLCSKKIQHSTVYGNIQNMP